MSTYSLVNSVKRAAFSWEGKSMTAVYDNILEGIGNAKVVMIGEASHGTEEFYYHRAEITKRLIEDKGFSCVCVEGDWPDCYLINNYVKGKAGLKESFSKFTRFPLWMWRNHQTIKFARWLKDHNSALENDTKKVGFYGLDLYSLHSSMHEVLKYLQEHDPAAAKKARERYACFDHFSGDAQEYGMETCYGMKKSCENEVVTQLTDMRLAYAKSLKENHDLNKENEYFSALTNAIVVKDSEEYYRGMFTNKNTWNMRDSHMTETLDSILKHITAVKQQDKDQSMAKAVVWAHNSHLGDSSFTDSRRIGQKNVGQYVRAKYGLESTFNIGFSTYSGTVTAASEWSEPGVTMKVRPSDPETWEYAFHQTGIPNFHLRFRANPSTKGLTLEEKNLVEDIKDQNLLERAIGVIYRPRTERMSHLFTANVCKQFDCMIHIDYTNALKKIDEGIGERSHEDMAETFPFEV